MPLPTSPLEPAWSLNFSEHEHLASGPVLGTLWSRRRPKHLAVGIILTLQLRKGRLRELK